MLIILDNIRDSTQARPLLTTPDTCITLITSRNRLRSLAIREGVRNITVPPLSEQDSLDLLTTMIGRTRAHAEPEALRALARLSCGLPLALRIIGEDAAERTHARVADLTDELNAGILDDQTDTDGDADLATVFAWSYNALNPQTARMFRVLGLHPASTITPEAAAAMLASNPRDTDHALNTLAKAHLINHDTLRRYRFHDLLHLYAASRAKDQETPEQQHAALNRLLDWYLLSAANAAAVLAPHRAQVPDLPTPEVITPQPFPTDVEAMNWCKAERANITAITRWAAGNGFNRHGWQIPGAIHEIFERYGRQDDVLELQQIALASANRDDHKVGQIGTLNNLGATHFALHDYGQATESVQAALRLAQQIGYTDAETLCSHNLASIHLSAGDTTKAIRIYQQVLTTCRATTNRAGEASTLHRLGDAHRRLAQYDQAIAYYDQALTIRQQLNTLRGQGATHTELAALHLETGTPDLALLHARLALQLHQRTQDQAARCDALITIADAERELAAYTDAHQHAQEALDTGKEIADPRRQAHALAVLVDILTATGNATAARQAHDEAHQLLDTLTEAHSAPLRRRLQEHNA